MKNIYYIVASFLIMIFKKIPKYCVGCTVYMHNCIIKFTTYKYNYTSIWWNIYVSLSLPLSYSLFHSLSFFISLYIYTYFSLCITLSLSLSSSLYLSLFIFLCLSLSLFLPYSLSIETFVIPPICKNIFCTLSKLSFSNIAIAILAFLYSSPFSYPSLTFFIAKSCYSQSLCFIFLGHGFLSVLPTI